MVDLKTNYLGLQLRNPLIVSSSGLTDSVDKVKKLEDHGAGAVVLKSLFEEQINYEAGSLIIENLYPEAHDYILNYVKSNSVDEYLKLIAGAKKAVKIPVIASVNCISAKEWIDFTGVIEKAGADAIELNLFFIATDRKISSEKYEKLYNDLVAKVKEVVKIPVSVKIGFYFTNLIGMVNNLYIRGVKGVVLFNRFYEPDIDIENLKLTTSNVLSSPGDIRQSLRWTGIISDKLRDIDIAVSTGVHNSDAVVKQILAGAKAVQICSTLYKNGIEKLPELLTGLERWMEKKNFKSVDEFRGKLNYSRIPDPDVYERSQFMKYFSNFQ